MFQTSMVSVEGLAKLVDPSQLTDDFEGSLDYNHEEWMDLRVSLEEFMSNAVHLLSRLEDLQVGCAHNEHHRLKEQPQKIDVRCVFQELLSKKEFPSDVEGSRRLIEEHTQLKKKVREVLKKQADSLSLTAAPQSFPPPFFPSAGAQGSGGRAGPRRPEAAAVHPLQ